MSTSSRILVRATLAAGAMAAVSLLAACGSAEPGQPATPPGTSAPGTPATGPSSAPAVPPSSVPPSSVPPSAVPPSSVPPSAVPPAPPPSGGAGAGLAACRTAALRITVDDTQSGGAAGSAYYPLNFTNMTAAPCEMYGYPGVSFAAAPDASGAQIGNAAKRSQAFAKMAVRLGPGATAHAWLQVTVAANYPASDCKPVTAHWLRVYPPEETVPGYVSRSFAACSATSLAQLTVLPVRSGQGLAGVTP